MNEAYNTYIIEELCKELSLEKWQVENVVNLIDEGNTIPFIARYRKEQHGTLSDEVLRNLDERLKYLRNLTERKEAVLASIEEQGKLTEELKEQIEKAMTLVEVEDLYRPYKPKRRTRGMIAREKGLEPLAQAIMAQTGNDPAALAPAYVDEEKGVATAEEALAGAHDIIAEDISDEADFRSHIRKMTMDLGQLKSQGKEGEESVYEMYYDFTERLKKLQNHHVLAVNRGEKEKFLKVAIEAPVEDIEQYLERKLVKSEPERAFIVDALKDAYKRLIAPSIENEIRAALTEKAEDESIKVFGKNLQQLLMQPPISGATVLGFDPGYTNGCKLAVVDPTGKVLDTGVIYPTLKNALNNADKRHEIMITFGKMLRRNQVSVIALGNGTASRESEQFIADTLAEYNPVSKAKGLKEVSYCIVNEAGASIYSASKLATEEFPDYDVNLRSAVSIARRLQDPLAELVKIDPKSIGVGQYQHDMDQKKLSEALGGVVEECVNRVGVDLNTASPSLLSYVSGVSKPISKAIVAYREENGSFKTRQELLKVPKLGPKAFEQCAGFLRIADGPEPFDNTAVHPESYEAARGLLTKMGYNMDELTESGALRKGMPNARILFSGMDKEALSEELGVGVPTLQDIVAELAKPGRDPRSEMPPQILRTDVLSMEDLKEGMILKGTVRNVIDFGAFVDIGVHQDGLVHVSQMSNKFVKHPLDVVKVGDIVEVKVISLDIAKKRIGLSMKLGK